MVFWLMNEKIRIRALYIKGVGVILLPQLFVFASSGTLKTDSRNDGLT